jgi:3-deoxy-manno-octulosonate cytidylyltransferase (CMP-KDO synthetase)
MKKIVAVIPARYQSSRFPGKPLALIDGKTMIQRVYERVSSVDIFEQVIVATDDVRIYKEVASFNGNAVMTGKCNCGTERVYEAVRTVECDIILNIQGDEPLIKKDMICDLIDVFNEDDVIMATLKKRITNKDDIENLNIVKVISDQYDNALYFSRLPIPYNRDRYEGIKYYKHIGIYGYTKKFLKEYVQMPRTMLEISENLEQLRVLENGYKIKVAETLFDSIGVDLPEHIHKIEEELKNER